MSGLGFTRIGPYYELPDELVDWLVFMELLGPAERLSDLQPRVFLRKSATQEFTSSSAASEYGTIQPRRRSD